MNFLQVKVLHKCENDVFCTPVRKALKKKIFSGQKFQQPQWKYSTNNAKKIHSRESSNPLKTRVSHCRLWFFAQPEDIFWVYGHDMEGTESATMRESGGK